MIDLRRDFRSLAWLLACAGAFGGCSTPHALPTAPGSDGAPPPAFVAGSLATTEPEPPSPLEMFPDATVLGLARSDTASYFRLRQALAAEPHPGGNPSEAVLSDPACRWAVRAAEWIRRDGGTKQLDALRVQYVVGVYEVVALGPQLDHTQSIEWFDDFRKVWPPIVVTSNSCPAADQGSRRDRTRSRERRFELEELRVLQPDPRWPVVLAELFLHGIDPEGDDGRQVAERGISRDLRTMRWFALVSLASMRDPDAFPLVADAQRERLMQPEDILPVARAVRGAGEAALVPVVLERALAIRGTHPMYAEWAIKEIEKMGTEAARRAATEFRGR